MVFIADRHAQILAMLKTTGRVVSIEAATRLGVSVDTVRRDLAELEQTGSLRRVHGGAVRPAQAPARFAERLGEAHDGRAAVAARAAELLPREGLLAMGGGTTALLVARHLHRDFRGEVVTSSPDVALALMDHPGADVALLGGRLDRESQTVTGPDAVAALSRLRPDACVVGSCGVDPAVGVTFHGRDEAAVVRTMVDRSAWVIVLADEAKLGQVRPHVVVEPGEIDVLVTDASVPAFEAAGVQVVRP